MATFYIQVENDQPVNHPMLEKNVLEFYGVIPENFKPFERVLFKDSSLSCELFQKPINIYVSDDGQTWRDQWAVVDMTEEEKQAKINDVQSRPPGPNVILNVDTLKWEPTTEKPKGAYYWNNATGEWVKYVRPTNNS